MGEEKKKTIDRERSGNYAKMQEAARVLFLGYDQEEIQRRSFVSADEDYLYVEFATFPYRINRTTGVIECIEDKDNPEEAGFSDALTIYDVVTHDNVYSSISNEFITLGSLNSTTRVSSGQLGSDNKEAAKLIDENQDAFCRACEKYGKKVNATGDLNFEFRLFSFMPFQIRFWESDDEFEAQIKLMVDTHILDFILFETVYYAVGFMLDVVMKETKRIIAENRMMDN